MTINIDYKTLPEAKDWQDGQTYEVHLTVKQVKSGPDGAEFEIVEAQGEMMNQDVSGEMGSEPTPPVSRMGRKSMEGM